MTLTLQNITAGYGRVQVLHDVSVSVEPGEIVALIGPNGAGKSTLLRAATGLVRVGAQGRYRPHHRLDRVHRAGRRGTRTRRSSSPPGA